MTDARATYRGDNALAQLLKKAGSAASLADVKALVAGIAAAPEPHDTDAWVRLVTSDPEPALRTQLQALRSEFAAATDGIGEKGASADRLARLRAELKARGLDGFIVPLADEHQGEYIPRRAQRLAWLTGFTGSAGVAIALLDKAAFFTDGRYTLQAESQVDGALYEHHHVTEAPPDDWLADSLSAGNRLGFDPWLHTMEVRDRLARACERAGAELTACADNPVDAIWTEQPPAPLAPIVPHDIQFNGRNSADKRREIADTIAKAKADAAALSAPDSIAWLLNIRGGDVPCTPLPLSFAIAHRNGHVDLFVDQRKVVPELPAHLGNEVRIASPNELGPALDRLGQTAGAVLLDPASAPVWLFERAQAAGAKVVKARDPCAAPKARKSDAELAGMRASHQRDGAALVRFLAWLHGATQSGAVTEIEAAAELARLRSGGAHYQGPSFDTISGAGPNGAVVHYRVSPETDRVLEQGSLYLVDSGGQYLDGTTDVTRTVAIGTPSAEHRDRFTRVLKGHIALAMARFPRGTTGGQLDALARQFLWQMGLDYDHGTGHGVGSYLNVHEGPQRISKRPGDAPLEPGMIVSNEPGYYKAGAYGIRIENLVAVIEAADIGGAERPMLTFETLTLAPIDRALIAVELMSETELAWLNAYHARVRDALTPAVTDDASVVAWLEEATAPLSR